MLANFKIETTNQNEAKKYIGFWVLKQYFSNALNALTAELEKKSLLPSEIKPALSVHAVAGRLVELAPVQKIKHLALRSKYPELLKGILGEEVSFKAE